MWGVFDHAHLAIFDPHGGWIETKWADSLFHLRYVFRPKDKLEKSHNPLWIKAFKPQGVDFEGIVSGSPIGGLHFAQPAPCHPTTFNACCHVVLRWLSTCELPWKSVNLPTSFWTGFETIPFWVPKIVNSRKRIEMCISQKYQTQL
jgi:hypothetical protein